MSDAEDPTLDESRQQRRRRELVEAKRESALTKLANNAEAQVLGADLAEKFQKVRHMFFAFVRSQGRVRIPRADLEGLEPGSSIDCKVQENGDMMITFLKGGAPRE